MAPLVKSKVEMFSPRKLANAVNPICVVVCAYLAATSISNLLAMYHLADASEVAVATVVPGTPTEKRAPLSKDGAPLAATNMFCSDCQLLPDEPEDGPSQRTQLPLRLIATNISSEASFSFATVMNTQSLKQGAYSIGQDIPEAGVVRRIGGNYIEFVRSKDHGAGRVVDEIERIDFESGGTKLASRPAAQAASSASSGASLAEQYVRVLDETHFEVDRDLVGKLKGDPRLAGAQARPIAKDGRMAGVRLFAVRPNGLARAMGLRNGDTLVAANGVKLDSLEAALELMGQLHQKDHWSIDIERGGKPVQLQVDLK